MCTAGSPGVRTVIADVDDCGPHRHIINCKHIVVVCVYAICNLRERPATPHKPPSLPYQMQTVGHAPEPKCPLIFVSIFGVKCLLVKCLLVVHKLTNMHWNTTINVKSINERSDPPPWLSEWWFSPRDCTCICGTIIVFIISRCLCSTKTNGFELSICVMKSPSHRFCLIKIPKFQSVRNIMRCYVWSSIFVVLCCTEALRLHIPFRFSIRNTGKMTRCLHFHWHIKFRLSQKRTFFHFKWN